MKSAFRLESQDVVKKCSEDFRDAFISFVLVDTSLFVLVKYVINARKGTADVVDEEWNLAGYKTGI